MNYDKCTSGNVKTHTVDICARISHGAVPFCKNISPETWPSCHKCTASRFNCTWCIKNHRCSRYPLDDCLENDEFVAGQNSNGLSIPYRNGPEFCPRIGGSVTYIRVPSGSTEKITISGIHLRDYQMPVKCFFSIGSGKTVGARVIPYDTQNKLIECESVDFSYIQDSKIWNVPLKILWGSTHPKPLDNPKGMQVQMYKCEKMADSCGECLTQKPLYNCGWCSDEDACSIQRNCHNTANWLPSQSNCPNPQINKIYPLMGPREGGTLLTIEGRNLGKTYQDIVSNVDIDGIQCSPIRDDYVPSTKIVCITGAWTVDKGKKSGYVNVVVAEAFAARSPQTFTYVDPVIKSIDPKKGPKSGGTKVTLYGDYLDAGTEREVFFGSKDDDQYKCIIQSVNSMSLVCITPRVSKAGSPGKLLMQIDKQIVMTDMEFTYIKDPVISKVLRKTAIVSGGIMVDVDGEGFDNIKYPKMILYHQAKTYEGDCTVQSPSRLRCRSPMLDSSMMSSVKYEEGLSLNFGFILDNVMATQNLSRNATFGNFTIFQDPVFLKFENELKSYQKKNEYLTINGKNLNRIQAEDVSIRIGKEFCNGTFIMTEKLTCTPPKYQPPSRKGGKYPEVEVIIGSNFSQYIGQLKYDESEFPLPYEYIILIAVGGGVLVIAVIIVIIMYTMKAKKNDSMMKRMQIQMDNLELKVAKECKEAFAELQTDMTELTSDLYGQVAIPFWDYRTYCMRVLFPQETDIDHPVIKDLEVDYARRDSVEKGLKLFSQLINNKTFLLIFVRTLESHKHFTMRDRVNVASLISVALQTKMEYATDILKTLLAELIEKAVDGKNHPKLLLRRTESVAEKMLTNWFTFLLYKFLRECAGEPLFMLYSAMKSQVSKGPVDASTSEARYSLSEDKLIRQQIEYKLMTIYVQDMDQFTQSPHPVRVLDCDTISQVKEKILDAIYKNAPFSSRPIKDDVDLVLIDQSPPTAEWSSGYKGRLILQDDDSTTRVEGEYKRLNTLCHYKVPDGAYMTLVPKQPPSYNNLSLSSTEKSRFYVPEKFLPHHTRSPSFQRTVSPQSVHVDIVDNYGVKCYHLVKQHDNEANNQGDRGSKMVSEIYLTRLLATKGTLQQFVDDLFERIFSTAHRGTALPLAIKYMFDFLDDQALLHAIEPDIVHIWKSNSLPLRFWVNVIKNPNFVFDIYKSNIVDSCLSVAAQTFMDSCSMNEHRLGKDSPSSKLLYAKDIPKYKKWVERYYQDVKMMPAISDQDMTAMLTDESRQHLDEFNTTAALYELYKYVQKYSEDLFAALEEDEFAKKNRLTYKLEQVRMAMDAEVYC
ncbi:hypothetical protein FSP39_015076 [Pinctada imbricata]|uniref:Plexin A n=1 Tax=Pinctada imbricata TaxID=66713 RepID=A0AA88YDA2_PINIB|nr:hypothetical protein FSP39_015076 [Pinctada imbricata]